MGRRPTKNLNLPKGMRSRVRGKRTYYLLDLGGKPRKEVPLAVDDYVAAIRKWAELTVSQIPAEAITFRHVAERYMREVLPTKSTATQDDNLRELEFLYQFFDKPPLLWKRSIRCTSANIWIGALGMRASWPRREMQSAPKRASLHCRYQPT